MKVLLISSRFHSFVGGVESVVASLAQQLKRKKHQILVIASKMGKAQKPQEEVAGIKVQRFWLNLPRSLLGLISFPVRLATSTQKLVKAAKEFNPNVIHYHFPDDSSVYVYLLTLTLKTPLILSIHGNDLQVFGKKPWYRFFLKKLVGRANRIVVHSNYMKSQVVQEFPGVAEKVYIIPNGVDDKFFKESQTPSKNYIFSYGRFAPKKAFDVLITAFSNIKNQTDRDLVIVGDGAEKESLQELVEELELEGRVTFPGEKRGSELLNYLHQAALAVIPSRREPFGIVALELMAAGKAIIASRTGGLTELLSEGQTALFFENENAEELADKILTLDKDPALVDLLEANAKKEAKKYRWDNIVGKYIDIYKVK